VRRQGTVVAAALQPSVRTLICVDEAKPALSSFARRVSASKNPVEEAARRMALLVSSVTTAGGTFANKKRRWYSQLTIADGISVAIQGRRLRQ
jgi:hypothetical protein